MIGKLYFLTHTSTHMHQLQYIKYTIDFFFSKKWITPNTLNILCGSTKYNTLIKNKRQHINIKRNPHNKHILKHNITTLSNT